MTSELTQREAYQRGYAAGYRAAQEAMNEQTSGPVPGGGPDQKAGVASGPLDQHELDCPGVESQYQPAATPSAGSHDSGAASAVMEEVAADPIADLCERLRALCVCHRRDHDSLCAMCAAADALERLARERDGAHADFTRATALLDEARAERDEALEEFRKVELLWKRSAIDRDTALKDLGRALQERIDRVIQERDALRECVRAADAMALECGRVGLISSTWLEDYDDARAKVTLP